MCTNTSKTKLVRLFSFGQIVATPGALEALDRAAVNAADLIQRHQSGDWGNVPPGDAEENDRSVKNGWRILSNYPERRSEPMDHYRSGSQRHHLAVTRGVLKKVFFDFDSGRLKTTSSFRVLWEQNK